MQDVLEHPVADEAARVAAPPGTKTAFRPQRGHWLRLALIALAVVVADQLTKAYAVLTLTTVHLTNLPSYAAKLEAFLWQRHPYPIAHQTLIDGFFDLRYIENPGAAWGFLSRSGLGFRTPLFLTISLISMVLVVGYFRRTTERQSGVRLALALVLGGAIGNFADRVRLGYVIDFIDWHIVEHFHWPTFNVADAAITIGALLLLIDMLMVPPKVPLPAPEP